jgi:hypothetical protein
MDSHQRSPDGSPQAAAQPAADPEVHGTGSTKENHAPSPSTADPDPSQKPTTNEPDDRLGLDRAEAIVDSLAARLSSVASTWGRQFLRLASRARESFQDFWAEVQDFRRGKKP